MTDPTPESVFFELHSGLPRQGPGSRESTRRAFSLLKDLPGRPLLADIGCGPGQQTLHLAGLTRGRIVAVDLFAIYLDELRKSLAAFPPARRVQAVRADMAALPFRAERFDLLWSEGAIYIIGFEAGLKRWRPLVKPGGYVVVTEATWLTGKPPEKVRRFWNEAYPAMKTAAGNLTAAKQNGYTPVGHFVLPDAAWWKDYYRPLERKLVLLQNRWGADPAVRRMLELEQAEIDLFRRHSDSYGYVFYILRKG